MNTKTETNSNRTQAWLLGSLLVLLAAGAMSQGSNSSGSGTSAGETNGTMSGETGRTNGGASTGSASGATNNDNGTLVSPSSTNSIYGTSPGASATSPSTEPSVSGATTPGSTTGMATGTTSGAASGFGATTENASGNGEMMGTSDDVIDGEDIFFGDEGDFNAFEETDDTYGEFPTGTTSSGATTPGGDFSMDQGGGFPNDTALPSPTPFDDAATGTDFDATGP